MGEKSMRVAGSSNMRIITGIILIVLSVTSFLFWEIRGRDMVYSEKLVVTSGDVMAGEILSRENIAVKEIGNNDVISGAADAGMYESLLGKTSKQFIPQGSQINSAFVTDRKDLMLKGHQSIFSLDSDMIGMVSSSLRRGDRVRIYGNGGKKEFGEFTVAFVKDNSDREVKNSEKLKNDTPMEREDSNYRIDSVEIICSMADYSVMKDFTEMTEEGLTIVQAFEGNVE